MGASRESVRLLQVQGGICISRPPALCLAHGPGPQFYLPALAPNLCLPAPAPNLCLPALAPNFYLPALVSLGLHIPTLSPQFVFTGSDLRLLLLCSDFAFTFLSIVVAVAVVILAIVVTS